MRLTDRPRRLEEMRGDVAWPAELQRVLDRALERQASHRYTSAVEFGRDFARAVEHMPESAAMTAGTVVLGAVADVPPTRVGDPSGAATQLLGAAAPARVPAGAPAARPGADLPRPGVPKPMTAILSAVAVLAVLGGGAYVLGTMGGDAPPAASPDSAVVTPADSVAQAGAATPQPVAPPAGEPVREAARPAAPAAAPATRGTSTEAITVVLQRAEGLVDAGLEDLSAARRALGELNRIDHRFVMGSEEHIWAQLLRAEAHAALSEERQVCSVLGTIQRTPENANRADRIAMLRLACQ